MCAKIEFPHDLYVEKNVVMMLYNRNWEYFWSGIHKTDLFQTLAIVKNQERPTDYYDLERRLIEKSHSSGKNMFLKKKERFFLLQRYIFLQNLFEAKFFFFVAKKLNFSAKKRFLFQNHFFFHHDSHFVL